VSGQSTETWLTQEAYDRRKAELDQLSGEGRSEIAKKIEAAREEGDLKENGGYHAAKEEQGKIEGAHPRAHGSCCATPRWANPPKPASSHPARSSPRS
jgi:hypothetical protein